jgi:DNA polymerase III, gamma/tau subunits
VASIIESMIDKNITGRFLQLMKKERLAHAYLLIGPEGSGKVETAVAIAKMVNCEQLGESFCGECPSCRKIEGGNHPDILMIDQGEDKSIKIYKIRELIKKTQLRPYEAMKKVVVIKDVDLMTTEGANALLKTLEEPTESSLLLLTTANPERILEQ